MTNLNRINYTGHSGASILAAGMGMIGPQTIEDMAHPIYRAIRRRHKQELLDACNEYSMKKGLRLSKRVLP